MSATNGELTRTAADPNYADVNRNAMRRNRFMNLSGWLWVQKNRPDIADVIRAEAQKRWPSPKKGGHTATDYSFLEEVQS